MSKNKKDTSYYYDRYGAPNAQDNSENAESNQNNEQTHASDPENPNPNAGGGNSGGNQGYNPNFGDSFAFGYDRQNYDGVPPNERELDIMDIKTNKLVYILSFLWILFFLPLVVCPNAKNARFYANQGLVLLLAGVVVSLVLGGIGWISNFFIVTKIIWSVISWCMRTLLLVLTVLGIVWVAQNEKRPLPVIGKIVLIK